MLGVDRFVNESNRIEGILRPPTKEEIKATKDFLRLPVVVVSDLEALVSVYAPGHRLRDQPGLDVRVGNHLPMWGGPDVRLTLESILFFLPGADPWITHTAYETLHPFTDGNGRSGRALWAWHMHKIDHGPFRLPFLHRFYYQTLEHVDGRNG